MPAFFLAPVSENSTLNSMAGLHQIWREEKGRRRNYELGNGLPRRLDDGDEDRGERSFLRLLAVRSQPRSALCGEAVFLQPAGGLIGNGHFDQSSIQCRL